MSVLAAPLATRDLAAAIAAWATSAAPALADAYAYPPADRGLLPDVAVLVTHADVVRSHPQFQGSGHKLLRVFLVELLLVVEPDPVATATDSLTDLADALTESVLDDRTLGGRVPAPGASALVTFASAPDPSEVQFPDGTLGRVGRFGLTVGVWLAHSR